jgi:acyl-CoA synthetase (AMP-forming)/AMP-acid ligase II
VSLRAPGAADDAELVAWVRDRLAHYKAPRSVVILDELPKGGTGKIQKQQLRDWGTSTFGESPAEP